MKPSALFLILVISCSPRDEHTLNNCSTYNTFIYKHKELNTEVYLPKSWEIELDFIMGDTLSVTALDTSYYSKTDSLRSIGLIQYSSTASPSMNLDAIEVSINSNSNVNLVNSGKLVIRDLTLPYFLILEKGDYATSNLIIYIQHGSEVINLFLRLNGEKSNINDYCVFNELIYANSKQFI